MNSACLENQETPIKISETMMFTVEINPQNRVHVLGNPVVQVQTD